MIRSTSEELNKGARQKRIFVTVLLASFVIVLVLSVASYVSTQVMWDGMFPSGEYHLLVQDQAGNPVEGAFLNIYAGKSAKHAFEYPFDNYLSENSLASNAKGEIVVTHLPRGFEFGGSGWHLFWVIPVNIGAPEFTCQISADGYKTLKFPDEQIFDEAYNAYKNDENVPEKKVQINGREFTLAIYEQSVTLKEK